MRHDIGNVIIYTTILYVCRIVYNLRHKAIYTVGGALPVTKTCIRCGIPLQRNVRREYIVQ